MAQCGPHRVFLIVPTPGQWDGALGIFEILPPWVSGFGAYSRGAWSLGSMVYLRSY